ncbi:hypothetical protein BJX61DRAFT_545952 [Aspergillus egyptiacus]|nr:hypothetical protein BJX61DRAFT_545952 [Aspergillus egyptiacus]
MESALQNNTTTYIECVNQNTTFLVDEDMQISEHLASTMQDLHMQSDYQSSVERGITAPDLPAPSGLVSVCHACNEDFALYDLARGPCGHDYCRGCIENWYGISMKGTTDIPFPPRCCGRRVDIGIALYFLRAELIQKFNQRMAEAENTHTRVLCYKCSKLINPENIAGDVATCATCSRETCTICGQAAHEQYCPHQPETQQFLELAREKGWKKCYRCGYWVERGPGCRHILCRCGAQFCYDCARPWTECNCISRESSPRRDQHHQPGSALTLPIRTLAQTGLTDAENQSGAALLTLALRQRHLFQPSESDDEDFWAPAPM